MSLEFDWGLSYDSHISHLDGLSVSTGLEKGIASSSQSAAMEKINALEERLAKLSLITRALFEIQSEKSGVTEEELARKIREIDLRDGKADGKMTATPKPCPSCKRIMSARFKRCLFCGYESQGADPFNAVK